MCTLNIRENVEASCVASFRHFIHWQNRKGATALKNLLAMAAVSNKGIVLVPIIH